MIEYVTDTDYEDDDEDDNNVTKAATETATTGDDAKASSVASEGDDDDDSDVQYIEPEVEEVEIPDSDDDDDDDDVADDTKEREAHGGSGSSVINGHLEGVERTTDTSGLTAGVGTSQATEDTRTVTLKAQRIKQEKTDDSVSTWQVINTLVKARRASN